MKTTIEQLNFPCDIKNKLKMKVGTNIKYIDDYIINIDKIDLSIIEPHKIIVKNKVNTFIAYFYENNDKIYLPISNSIISFTKFVAILNKIKKNYQLFYQ